MKIYLDDERPTPNGWIRCFWPDEVIQLLQTEDVEIVSLDHDLGNEKKGTGYDVILWIEEQVYLNSYQPPKIVVHSANSSARAKMENAINSINRKFNNHGTT